ncbi:MAG TPA: TonB-dependent receptor, partial [Vicinamibacterales bacterium]|nr:TonB-dependent receptor [Vicinamibacterales bacterium]
NDPVVGIGSFTNAGGDPVAELRQVIPAEFRQLQGSARVDARVAEFHRLQVSYFAADFPSTDPFPDPSTLASPFPLRKNNRGQVASVGDTHIFGNSILNEFRVGFFTLRNTRRLDDDIIGLTSDQFGIVNPALLFDDSAATRRLGHFVNRGISWSFGAPNDAFNRREQETVHFSDVLSVTRGNHNLRIGGDFKLHNVKTNLPEEQGTEFEKIEHFQQFLLGFTSEADTQFGFTDKHFQMQDASWFVTDDWRVGSRLSVTLGVRWDWFGWPYEKNGFFGNFDPALVTDPANPIDAILVPSNIQNSQFSAVNAGIAAVSRAETKHTLNGQDLNNFAPRLGFAYTAAEKHVIRGGYGLFYDRPSAAFMNTVFSNYPILREIEITVPSRQVPITNAFASNVINGQPTPFDVFFPFRLVYTGGTAGTYQIRDGTGVFGVNGGQGNIAETLEFRAIDRDLQTPYYQQWNIGWQWEIAPSVALEVRYNGSRGHNLLLATALNEPWDLNDPNTPREILDRITAAYRANGGTANPQDPNALGYGYGGDNNRGPAGTIPTEVRTLYYGFNDAEALYLQSAGRSTYHALQTSVTKRFSHGYQFHAAYTYSVARDLMSADPGSTAGGGRPDTPNTGFSVENDSRDLESNWARADFDRPHRFSLSAVWNLPMGDNAFLKDWELATFMQFQSGRPFSVFRPEQGLLRLGFQRLDFVPGATAESVAQQAANPEEGWFDKTQLRAATAAGNTPRNFLRGPSQQRVDLSISKRVPLGGRIRAELRWEIFNLFNTVNFGIPENNFDSVDFGTVTNTVGGPRVSQFGVRVTF